MLKGTVKAYTYGAADVDCFRISGNGKKANVTFSILDKIKREKGWTVEVYKDAISKASLVSTQKVTANKKISFKTKKGVNYYLVVKSAGSKKAGHDVIGAGYSLKLK